MGRISRQWLGAMPSGMVAGQATAASSRHKAAPPGFPHHRLPGFPQHAVEVLVVDFSKLLSQSLRVGFITSTGTGTAART